MTKHFLSGIRKTSFGGTAKAKKRRSRSSNRSKTSRNTVPEIAFFAAGNHEQFKHSDVKL
jgi:hypothetical protein